MLLAVESPSCVDSSLLPEAAKAWQIIDAVTDEWVDVPGVRCVDDATWRVEQAARHQDAERARV